MIRGGAILACGLVAAFAVAACGGSSTTTVTETTTAPSPVSTAAVVQLQKVMTTLGYYDGPINGSYGPATTDAVKKMQAALGVTADGVYGPRDPKALKAKGTGVVVTLQTELSRYGYYDGPSSGVYDAKTADAVTALQKDLGVDADGRFGPETAQAFGQAVADGTITPK
jgi:peptidoglycan hydrolase-like protein with peptidoglycan-binding domain